MKVGFCQFDIKHKDVEANLNTIKTMLMDVDADLIVLPELALTGYFFDNKEELMALSTQDINEKAFEQLRQIALKKSMIIIIGLAEIKGDKIYNTAFMIDASGVVGKHRKIHLTDNESIFSAGHEIQVFEVAGVKVGMAICFDAWFPELFRRFVDLGADIICCPANFGGPWTIDVVKVRALENVIPVILSNRTGYEYISGVKEYFCGNSMVVDGYGNPLIHVHDQPYVGIVDIDTKDYNRQQSLICHKMVEEKEKYDN